MSTSPEVRANLIRALRLDLVGPGRNPLFPEARQQSKTLGLKRTNRTHKPKVQLSKAAETEKPYLIDPEG